MSKSIVRKIPSSGTSNASKIMVDEIADEINDDGTEDLLIGHLRAHQKMLWMLKSSL